MAYLAGSGSKNRYRARRYRGRRGSVEKRRETGDNTSKMRFPLSTRVQIERTGIRPGSIGSRVSLIDTKKSIFTHCFHRSLSLSLSFFFFFVLFFNR